MPASINFGTGIKVVRPVAQPVHDHVDSYSDRTSTSADAALEPLEESTEAPSDESATLLKTTGGAASDVEAPSSQTAAPCALLLGLLRPWALGGG